MKVLFVNVYLQMMESMILLKKLKMLMDLFLQRLFILHILVEESFLSLIVHFTVMEKMKYMMLFSLNQVLPSRSQDEVVQLLR